MALELEISLPSEHDRK